MAERIKLAGWALKRLPILRALRFIRLNCL